MKEGGGGWPIKVMLKTTQIIVAKIKSVSMILNSGFFTRFSTHRSAEEGTEHRRPKLTLRGKGVM